VTGRKLKLMHKEFVFLLNQCPPVREASRVRKGIAALETVGSLMRPHIAARADFLEAMRTGKGVTEVDPKGTKCATFGWISAAGSGQFKLADEQSPSLAGHWFRAPAPGGFGLAAAAIHAVAAASMPITAQAHPKNTKRFLTKASR
jgi:hypothetical protein